MGAVRRPAPNMCATPRAICRAPELSENGWLHVSKTDDTQRDGARGRAHGRRIRRGGRAVAGRPGARGVALAAAIFTACIIRVASACIRSIMRLGSPPPRRPPARASSRIRRCWRSIRRACASASSPDIRASARRMWCSPATCIWRELVPQFASTLLPIYSTTIVTEPLGDELLDAIRYPGAVSDDRCRRSPLSCRRAAGG